MRIDQVTPDLVGRDAVGMHILNVQATLRNAGIESEIFYEDADDDMAALGLPIEELFEPVRDRKILFQMAIGSPGFDLMFRSDDPVMVQYHNITPAELIAPWEPAIAAGVKSGRAQLAAFARRCSLGLGVSTYNQRELIDLGSSPTDVAPLLLDMRHEGRVANPQVVERLTATKVTDGPSLLFVGKVSPHKAPHDLVNMLSTLRSLYYPNATLTLVGSPLGTTYIEALRGYITSLDLDDAVTIVGGVSGDVLEAHWQAADVFVCASEHEGFCAPLIEAMGHGLPVVSYGSTAIPETVADAGLILSDKSPLVFAASVHKVLEDEALRDHLIERGRRRARYFDLDQASVRFLDAVLQRPPSK